MSEFSIRAVTVEDVSLVAYHRVEMFREMGEIPTEALARALLADSVAALRIELQQGRYFGWFAVDAQGRVIAGVGAHLKPTLPRVTIARKRVAITPVPLVVNVYTERDWRRRGVAKQLMHTLLHWAREQNFDRVILHASKAGRPLYEGLGFVATNEMRWNSESPA